MTQGQLYMVPSSPTITKDILVKACQSFSSKGCVYGFQQEQEILVSWFFEFLVSWQEMGDKKQEIDFLHFLVNFDQIVGLFDDF